MEAQTRDLTRWLKDHPVDLTFTGQKSDHAITSFRGDLDFDVVLISKFCRHGLSKTIRERANGQIPLRYVPGGLSRIERTIHEWLRKER
jgi:hypothetical protein